MKWRIVKGKGRELKRWRQGGQNRTRKEGKGIGEMKRKKENKRDRRGESEGKERDEGK